MKVSGKLKLSICVTLALIIKVLIYCVSTNSDVYPNQDTFSSPSSPLPSHDSEIERNRLARGELERLIEVLATVSAAPPESPLSDCQAPALRNITCQHHTGLRGKLQIV